MTHIILQLPTLDEWKFVSMETMVQSVTLAGMKMLLKWRVNKYMEIDTVSLYLRLSNVPHYTNNYATIVGDVYPSLPLPLSSHYLVQDIACNGTESSISQCSYDPRVRSECHVGSHSAAVACRLGKTGGNFCL